MLALVLGLAACAGGPQARDISTAGPPPPAGRMIEVAGHRVHARVAGTGPAVILLHGAGGNLRDFTFDLVGRLSDRYRVIAFDRPGHGYTPPLGKAGASPAAQAALLDAAAGKLGVRRAVIVGHSYGGAVAMAWALGQPERAAAVVSLAGAVMPWEGSLGPWYTLAASRLGGALVIPAVSTFATDGLAHSILDGIFAPQDPPEGYFEHIGVELALRPRSLRANARQVAGLKSHLRRMAVRYPTLDLPVEIVHGDADDTVPLDVHSRPLARLVPGANLTVLEGVGHMVHHADPQAAVAAIDRAAARAGLR